MPASSCRKICRQFRVGKYAGNFESEKKVRAMPHQNKMSGNSGRIKMPASLGKKKMSMFLGWKKIDGKAANLQVCKKTFIQECIRKVMYRIQLGQDFLLIFSSPDFFLTIRRRLPALPISGKVASLINDNENQYFRNKICMTFTK